MTADDGRLLLAQREFDEAVREWDAARLLAERDFFRQAVTRAHFSAFHAVQGLLAAHGLQAATHEHQQRLIGLHFVMPGLLFKDAGRALSSLQARRQEADYRLLVEVDRASWEAAHADALTVLRAIDGHRTAALPQLKLDLSAISR